VTPLKLPRSRIVAYCGECRLFLGPDFIGTECPGGCCRILRTRRGYVCPGGGLFFTARDYRAHRCTPICHEVQA